MPLNEARAGNKEDSGDETDEEGGVIDGFNVEGLKDDTTS